MIPSSRAFFERSRATNDEPDEGAPERDDVFGVLCLGFLVCHARYVADEFAPFYRAADWPRRWNNGGRSHDRTVLYGTGGGQGLRYGAAALVPASPGSGAALRRLT